MQITAEIDIGVLVESLTYGCGDNDPIDFIMAIDQSVGDEGFTEDLLLRLAQSYEKEYITYEESITEKALNSTFVEGPTTGYLRNTAAELTYATSKREKLSQIVSLIKSLGNLE